MPTLLNLPAIQAPQNALLDFSGINNAIDDYRKRSELEARKQSVRDIGQAWQNKDFDQATTLAFRSGDPQLAAHTQQMAQNQQEFERKHRDYTEQKLAAAFQMVDKLPPEQRDAAHDRILALHPDAFKAGFSQLPEIWRNDRGMQRQFLIASVLGPKDPLDQEQKRATIANLNSQAPMNRAHADFFTAQAEQLRKKPEAQLKEVNGKLVAVSPDMKATEIYNAGPDLSKTPEHVAKSANFAARMVEAEDYLRKLMADPKLLDPTSTKKAFDPTTSKTMAINAMPETFANWALRSPEHQQYMQAAESWIRAFLRKESGAAISKDEFARDFKVYFPQPGDKPEVLAQKEAMRARVTQGMANEARDVFPILNPDQAARLKVHLGIQSRAPGQQIPPDAVRFLKANPHLAAEFDAKYGPNSSKQFLTP